MEELKQERLEREKEFHNNVFISGARAVTDKYYKSVTESKEFYHKKYWRMLAIRRFLNTVVVPEV